MIPTSYIKPTDILGLPIIIPQRQNQARPGFFVVRGIHYGWATDYDDRTIPSFLAASLNEEKPLVPAYLTNYGEPSFNSLMEAKYLEKVLIDNIVRPDIIIFYDGANDCTYFAQTANPTEAISAIPK